MEAWPAACHSSESPASAGTRGPISAEWNVRGWPTIYIVDHKGVIRAKNKRGDAMEEAVMELLAEVDDEK
jgi:hypothetical protein